MSLTLSPQLKIVALVGLLAALALGAGSMLLARSQSSSSATTAPTVPIRHFHPRSLPATKTQASARRTPAPPGSTVAARPTVKPVVPAKPKPAPPVAPDGLPTPLDVLLHTHRIVVVALYDPEVQAERTIALPEARAGAEDAGAGFLAVNVLDDRVASPLTAAAGHGTILPDPGVLVYRQPALLVNTLEGFADRDTVAAAVADALTASAPPAVATTPAATTAPPVAPPAAPATP